LNAGQAPAIILAPASQELFIGQPATLAVLAVGEGELKYQWSKDGVLLPGEVSSTFQIREVGAQHVGEYSVTVSNQFGSVSNYVPESVSAGWTASMFIKNDGTVWAVGSNENSQIGIGAAAKTAAPVQVGVNAKAVQICLQNSYYITSNNKLYVTGTLNLDILEYYRNNKTTYTKLLDNVSGVGTGQYHGVALMADGTSTPWNGNLPLFAAPAVNVRAGMYFNWFYVTSEHKLYGAGHNTEGQLGVAITDRNRNKPVFLRNGVVDVAGGYMHSLILDADGSLWVTGANSYGQLGTGDYQSRRTPINIAGNVVSIHAGSVSSLFIKNDGTLWGMGRLNGTFNSLTDGNHNRPILIAADVVMASAGKEHLMYVKKDGTLWVIGGNNSGQLGLGDYQARASFTKLADNILTSLPSRATISVKPTQVEVSPRSQIISLQVGHQAFLPKPSVRYVVIIPNHTGNAGQYVTAKPVYTSSNVSVATIDNDKIYGVAPGTTKLNIKYGEIEPVELDVVVVANNEEDEVVSIKLMDPPTVISIGQTLNLDLEITYKNGKVLRNPSGVSLSANESRATIIGTSLTGAKSGSLQLLANAGLKTALFTMEVLSYRIETPAEFLRIPAKGSILRVPVVIINYIPTKDGLHVDQDWFPMVDYGGQIVENFKISELRKWLQANDIKTKYCIEEGSRFRGYKDSFAVPYVGVEVIKEVTFYEIPKAPIASIDGEEGYAPDYDAIFNIINLEGLVNDKGVKEVWFNRKSLFTPESNMASPVTADISNSYRMEDLPIYNKTYVVYGNFMHRWYAENIHNRGHQIEVQLAYLNSDFFLYEFVGQRRDGKPYNQEGRVGNTHFTPNSEYDYDYYNPDLVLSDIQDWVPGATGLKKYVSAQTWTFPRYFTAAVPSVTALKSMYDGSGEAMVGHDGQGGWLLYWFQSIPGFQSKIFAQGKEVTNWWDLFYNWDDAVRLKKGLWRAVTYAITAQPRSQQVGSGQLLSLSVSLSNMTNAGMQWFKDGVLIPGATALSFSKSNADIFDSGTYWVTVTTPEGVLTSDSSIATVIATSKVAGTGIEVGTDIVHPNGNIYDQVLIDGNTASIKADAGQITRASFIDLDDDIVQVEMSGSGTLVLKLETPSGPAMPVFYNQNVSYMKGNARITISGADETTNVTVFSVGRMTAVNQTLFKANASYDGFADIASIAIQSDNGKFGGIRAANAGFRAIAGLTGIYAPGVQFTGPVFVNEITATGSAIPVLQLGSASDVRITGGNLQQDNAKAVRVSGFTALKFSDGTDSHGNLYRAQSNQGKLELDGVDVTSQLVVKGP
jgi:alpha-tubulin suppressor-like RCC1 family protein